MERQTISFVIRLWREPSQQMGPPRWRAQIEHVESGERSHFQIPQALFDFLAAAVRTQQEGKSEQDTISEQRLR